MNFKITHTKVAIAFLIGFCLIYFSGIFSKIPWLFVTSILIGIVLIMSTMGYFLYHAINFWYNKLNGK